MVEVRYLSINSIVRTISLQERGESGYPPRTFNPAGLPQVVLITYLHFIRYLGRSSLFYFWFVLSWPRSWWYAIIESVLPETGSWLGPASSVPILRGILACMQETPLFFITTIFVQIPITKYNNRFRGFHAQAVFEQAGWT